MFVIRRGVRFCMYARMHVCKRHTASFYKHCVCMLAKNSSACMYNVRARAHTHTHTHTHKRPRCMCVCVYLQYTHALICMTYTSYDIHIMSRTTNVCVQTQKHVCKYACVFMSTSLNETSHQNIHTHIHSHTHTGMHLYL